MVHHKVITDYTIDISLLPSSLQEEIHILEAHADNAALDEDDREDLNLESITIANKLLDYIEEEQKKRVAEAEAIAAETAARDKADKEQQAIQEQNARIEQERMQEISRHNTLMKNKAKLHEL